MTMKMYKSFDDHIKSFPKEKQEKLKSIRELVRKTCPNAIETIRYGIPTFQLNGKNMIHFAGYENHIGFYPSPNGLKEFSKELQPYVSGKGTAKFKWDQPIPWSLIEKIIKFREKEINFKSA